MKYLKMLCISLFSVFLLSGCEEKYEGEAFNELQCFTYSDHVRVYVSRDNFLSGAEIEAGVCYSTYSNPTYRNNRVARLVIPDLSSSYPIDINIYYSGMNLTKGTKYYMRGYLKNETGIVYSNVDTYTKN